MIVCVLFGIMTSCGNHPSRYTETKKAVELYLSEANLALSYSRLYFAPCTTCKGCEEKMLKEFSKVQSEAILISCKPEILKHFNNWEYSTIILEDSILPTYQISQGLPFRVEIKEGKIENIYYYEAEL